MKKIFIPLFILLVFLSLFPRSIETLSHNYVFGFDQGRDYLAVKNIVIDHKFTLIGPEIGAGSAGFRGIFHGPFYYYFLSVPFVLFKGDPYGGVALMLLFGLLSIAFTFYLGKKLFGTIYGIIGASLVAISPPLVSQGRFIWNSHPTSLLILIAFYFVYLTFQQHRGRYVFLAAFFSGFIYNFELAIAIPMTLGFIIYYFLVFRFKEWKNCILIFLGVTSAFLPMILFEFKHNFMGFNGMISYLFSHKETAITLKSAPLLVKTHFDTFVYNFSDTFPRQNIIPGWIILAIFFIPALYFIGKEKNNPLKKFILYLLFLLPINFFVFFFLKAVYVYYLIDLNLVYILLFSYLIFTSYKKNYLFLKIILTLFIVSNVLLALFKIIPTSRYDISDYGGIAKVKGKTDAIDYIYKDAKGKNFNLLVFTPPVYTYAYDYLLWWYGEKTYHYTPPKDKKGLFYLLIEEDHSKPWSYEGWLETVIKTGKVLETKKLPSGFIIQKRIGEI